MDRYRVEIFNSNEDKVWRAYFEEKKEAKEWANQQIGKPFRSFDEIEIKIVDQIDEIEAEKLKKQKEKFLEKRKQKLQETDWTQLGDCELDNKTKLEYREYRKYLRRIPELFKRGQVLKLEAMSFEDWKENKPVYKDVDKRS